MVPVELEARTAVILGRLAVGLAAPPQLDVDPQLDGDHDDENHERSQSPAEPVHRRPSVFREGSHGT